jgi:hypothetical protein
MQIERTYWQRQDYLVVVLLHLPQHLLDRKFLSVSSINTLIDTPRNLLCLDFSIRSSSCVDRVFVALEFPLLTYVDAVPIHVRVVAVPVVVCCSNHSAYHEKQDSKKQSQFDIAPLGSHIRRRNVSGDKPQGTSATSELASFEQLNCLSQDKCPLSLRRYDMHRPILALT